MNTMLTAGHEVVPELRELLDADDSAAFEQALDRLLRTREQHLFLALGGTAPGGAPNGTLPGAT